MSRTSIRCVLRMRRNGGSASVAFQLRAMRVGQRTQLNSLEEVSGGAEHSRMSSNGPLHGPALRDSSICHRPNRTNVDFSSLPVWAITVMRFWNANGKLQPLASD